MIALTECPIEPLTEYNAVEVHAVRETKASVETIDEALMGLEPDAHYYWGVYLHLTEGGIEWVADFSTKEQAETFAKGVEFMLGAVIADKIIAMR